MATVTVRPQANDEDGFIRFGDDQTGFMGDVTSITTNARIKMGHHGGVNLGNSAYDPDTYTGWIHLKGAAGGVSDGTVGITQGSTINSAKLYLYYHASNMDAGFNMADPGEGYTVAAEDTDSGSKPTAYAHVNGWTLTSASVATGSLADYDSDDYSSYNEEFAAGWYPSAGLEIKTVIQELVNRSGWSAENNINLKLTPATKGDYEWDIEWKDYDNRTGSNYHPKLVIDFTAAGAAATTSPAFLMFVDL